MISNCFLGVYKGLFPDKRIEKRIESAMFDLLSLGTSVINKFAETHSQKMALYRMLSNPRFDHEDILEGSFRKCSNSISSNHVLAIQDTTEFNYNSIKKKITKLDPDIGPTSVSAVAGYFCHPMLIMDADSSSIFGLSSAIIYNRHWDQKSKKERNYAQLPIEDKESYRWIQASEETKERIPSEVQLTIIGDRENDIYEDFERVPDNRTNLLIRSRSDRNIVGNDLKLYNHLDQQEVQGSIEINIPSNTKRNHRDALLDIKFSSVRIKAPSNYKGTEKSIELYAIEVKENEKTIPEKELPIHWRLLTTHRINNIEQAIQCINWYKKRWFIEELFRVIKTKGFAIEDSQLGSGMALKKLLSMTLEAALHIMRLKLSLSDEAIDAKNIFNDNQLKLLDILQKKVEGETLKQKNPYRKYSLAWSCWTLARLASWSGYKSHGPPGYITIKEGFDRFNSQYDAFLLFQNEK